MSGARVTRAFLLASAKVKKMAAKFIEFSYICRRKILASRKRVSCGSSVNIDQNRYIGETNRHFNTLVSRNKNSHNFKHLSASKGCKDKCDIFCFKILGHASTYSCILELK